MGLTKEFLERIVQQFALNIDGIHGAEHWIRVYENGYRLSRATGANVNVVMWFSVLHDCQRVSNAGDLQHGPRAAAYARRHRKEIDLSEEEFELLVEAITCHTTGCDATADVTVQTCLDADRLDIGRTGCIVDQAWLYTEAAKNETMRSKKARRSR
jgi:uncharacterized protein